MLSFSSSKLQYVVYGLLNKAHWTATKYLLFFGAFAAVFIISHSREVARNIAEPFSEDKFKLGLRRLVWFIFRRNMKLMRERDLFADCSAGFDEAQALSIYKYIQNFKCRDMFFQEVWSAQLMAQVLEESLPSGSSLISSNEKINWMHEKINMHYEAAKSSKVPLINSSPKKIVSKRTSSSVAANVTNHQLDYKRLEMLLKIRDLAKKQGIKLFAVSGTFLGVVRDKNFIENDLDVDLGFFKDEYSPELLFELEALEEIKSIDVEYITELTSGVFGSVYKKHANPCYIKILTKTGSQFDLFSHFQFEDKVAHGNSSYLWVNNYFELAEYDFLGAKILGPSDADEYLTQTYGTWRIRDASYHHTRDSRNIAPFFCWKAKCFGLLRRVLIGD